MERKERREKREREREGDRWLLKDRGVRDNTEQKEKEWQRFN